MYSLRKFILKATKVKVVLLIILIALVCFETYLIIARLNVIKSTEGYYTETSDNLSKPRKTLKSSELYRILSVCDYINHVETLTEYDSTNGTLNLVRNLSLSDLQGGIRNLVEVTLISKDNKSFIEYLKSSEVQCELIDCSNDNVITFRVNLEG